MTRRLEQPRGRARTTKLRAPHEIVSDVIAEPILSELEKTEEHARCRRVRAGPSSSGQESTGPDFPACKDPGNERSAARAFDSDCDMRRP